MSDGKQDTFSFETVSQAYDRISPILLTTPVHFSSTFNKLVGDGKSVYFKCENFQKTGSFKARGALNAVLSKLSQQDMVGKYAGCIAHSSGNHGQAVAWACQSQSVPCTIVLPSDTPQVKVDAVRAYNARVVFCEPNPVSRVETCERIARADNLLTIKPYDDYAVMSGQGTVAREFLEQVPHLDAIFVSVSGGGLISGISEWAKHVKPSILIFAVEPVGKRLSECISKGERNLDKKPTAYLNTRAEGIKTEQCGELTFPIIQKYVRADDVFTVTDEEMIEATRFVFEKMKMVTELAGGAAVAAALSSKFRQNYPHVKNVGIILCGGNIDLAKLPWVS